MPPNLFSDLRLTDTLDTALGRGCVQLSPLELAGVLGWLCSVALAHPAQASTQKSLAASPDKRKLALLVLTQDVAPGAS